jgi:hypothetical protein
MKLIPKSKHKNRLEGEKKKKKNQIAIAGSNKLADKQIAKS